MHSPNDSSVMLAWTRGEQEFEAGKVCKFGVYTFRGEQVMPFLYKPGVWRSLP